MCENEKVRLPGAKFVLYDGCGKAIACGQTDRCGEVTFDNLPYGRYLLAEAEAPCGYEKSSRCREIVIGEDCRNACVEFVNLRRTGSVKVIKYGKNCT